ncbi:MAG: beta-phosphoglucomutase family hydrolase [Deltaproteobacteria bacterium]|nr:beta-phosphoglucomutase family hydrolase [Deltaproteobacteria bacterium]
MLGLPANIRGCLFDLDGVLTQTAKLHAAAWKQMFDAFLDQRGRETSVHLEPFDAVRDYDDFVDGKPREAGTRSFLASRGIHLPLGEPDDPPGSETIRGLAKKKNEIVLRLIRERGVLTYPGSIRYVGLARAAGLQTAVVSSSRNCREVLGAAGIEALFEARIDGNTASEQHLRGKPAPDAYLAAARALQLEPEQCAVFEDALAGVEAGRAGRFGCVIGIDRRGQADGLRAHGADLVVGDLGALLEPE